MAKWELRPGTAWRSGWPHSGVGAAHGERLFRLVFECSPIGMAIVGLDGRWLQVNPAMCAILGYSAEELLGLDFQTITHPDDAADDALLVRRLLAGEIDECQFGKRYLRKDGAVAPVIVSAALVRDEVGAPEHFLTEVVDLTVVRALEQAAGEQERLFRVAFDRSPIPQVIRGADDRLQAANPALARTLANRHR